MKLLLPMVLALTGLAAGVGAGIALKPDPAPATDACDPAAEDADCSPEGAGEKAKTASLEAKSSKDLAYVPIEKPFVVPVFSDERVVAMVVVSVSIETDTDGTKIVGAAQPRLRDSFLKAMFRHANSGGFDGSFTSGQKMDDLKSALLAAAQDVLIDAPVGEILITEIARQDV